MRTLSLLLTLLVSATLSAQQSGHTFRRAPHLPSTPAATPAADVTEASTPAPAARKPFAKLRSGRAWPRHHFRRLPVTPAATTPATRTVEARSKPAERRPRGFWEARS